MRTKSYMLLYLVAYLSVTLTDLERP